MLKLGLCVSKRILKLMGSEQIRNKFLNVKNKAFQIYNYAFLGHFIGI